MDAWNAAHPGCPPLIPYERLCAIPSAAPTEREEIIRWNQTHPYCPPIPVPSAPPAEEELTTGTVVLIVVAAAGGGYLLYRLVRRGA